MELEDFESETLNRVRQTESYLEYVKHHLEYISKALPYVINVMNKNKQLAPLIPELIDQVAHHDLSKMEGDEFIFYRREHYPTKEETEQMNIKEDYQKAKYIHTLNNPHHWQTASTTTDIMHMMVDWVAKGLENDSTPLEYLASGTEPIEIAPHLQDIFFHMVNELEREMHTENYNDYDFYSELFQ